MKTFLSESHDEQQMAWLIFSQGPSPRMETSTLIIPAPFTSSRPSSWPSQHDSSLDPGRQTPRLLTPCSDNVFDDENNDNISTELTEPETTPWLFRPIAPPSEEDYDLTEHDTFLNNPEDTFWNDSQDDEDDAWSTFMSGIPMEIEILNKHEQLRGISCVSNNQSHCSEDEDDEAEIDRIMIALGSDKNELPEFS